MNYGEAFRKAINAIIKNEVPIMVTSGTVTNVREHELDVEREGLPELLGVRFHSVIDEEQASRFKIIPKVGSEVLCAIIENDSTEAYLLACSEIEKVQITMAELVFEIEPEGVRISNKGQNLKTVLNDFQDKVGQLCTEVQKIVVAIGVSPDVAAIEQIKQGVTATNKENLNKILIE
jgi:hypothetical protein